MRARRLARAGGLVAGGLALLLGGMALRALRLPSQQVAVVAVAPLQLDEDALTARLSRALRFATVSHQDPAQRDERPFAALRDALQQDFPRVHERLGRELVAGGSLLYTWPGSEPALPPVVLLGHLDVVPVEPGSEGAWQQPPFSGAIAGGYVWGRGALDDKGGALAMLEALEWLLGQGHRPRRTVHLCLGQDEEVGGSGAAAMAALLRQRGVRPALVMDEGMSLTEGMVEGLSAPAALIGVAQKGYLTLELKVPGSGGHSSMPPSPTAIGALAAALVRLEERQLPAHLTPPVRAFLAAIAPEMDFPRRLVLGNLWLSAPLVERAFLREPASAALLRTTTAPTMLFGSAKENVLPAAARAVVNFRILPGEGAEEVRRHVQEVAGPGVGVSLLPGSHVTEPSPVSPVSGPAYAVVARALREVAPGAVVAPGLMQGVGDARHYEGMTPNIYRFRPFTIHREDVARVHGTNERIAVRDYLRCVRFYVQLLRDADAEALAP